jgi:AcrR family transcriptional regulator
MVPAVQNSVPPAAGPADTGTAADDDVALRVARRSASGRVDAYAGEVRALLDAALAVMQRSGAIDPPVRDIVRVAGLSNQAFYRHFASKDALLVALLDDGQRRLVGTLERRMARAEPGPTQVRAWIEGVLAQCRDARAAAATRPFVVHAARLAELHGDETAASTERLVTLLRTALDDPRDAQTVHDLAMATMHRHLLARTAPSREEVDHVVEFAIAGIHWRSG